MWDLPEIHRLLLDSLLGGNQFKAHPEIKSSILTGKRGKDQNTPYEKDCLVARARLVDWGFLLVCLGLFLWVFFPVVVYLFFKAAIVCLSH